MLLRIASPRARSRSGQTVAVIGEAGEAVPDAGTPEGQRGRGGSGRRRRRPSRARRRRQQSRGAASGDASASRRPRQGLAARAADGARARDRARHGDRHRPRRARRRRGRRARASRRRPRRPPPRLSPPARSSAIPLTSIRKTIARRLTAAWQVPVFQLTVSADMTRANALIERSRELDPDVRVTVTDLIARSARGRSMRHPDVNVQLHRRRAPALPVGEHRPRRRGAAGPRRARHPLAPSGSRSPRSRAARGDLVEPRARRAAQAAGSRGRHLHDLEPRHVRRRAVHRRPQPAAGGDPRGRRDRRPAGRARRRGRRPADDDA